jgi:glycosyltransferase involved in cell wall biosynthesis
MNCTIGIFIPLYNGIEFLEECLQSISTQTYRDWEAWIGVNGHGDDGGEVAQKAIKIASFDSRFHVVVQDSSISGKVASLHHLMTLLPPLIEWVALLDADDKWSPIKLEKQIQIINRFGSNVDVIATHCQIFGDRMTSPVLPSGFIVPDVLKKYNPIINSSSLIRRKWCQWEYNALCYGMEDYFLWMVILLQGGKIYNIPEKLTWHRVYSSSSFNSKQYSNDSLREWYSLNLNR